MFNLKFSGIIACIAFIFSFLLGIIGRSTMPMLLFKPFIFAFVFFMISILVRLIVGHFLPELVEENDFGEEPYQPGSRVDITDDDSADYSTGALGGSGGETTTAAPGFSFIGARPDDSEDGLGDISDLARKSSFTSSIGEEYPMGMDQNREDSYTEGGGDRGSQVKVQKAGGGEVYNPDETLPDLDSMAGVFMPSSSDGEPEGSEHTSHSPLKKPSSSAPAWTEDFNAKEMAQGLRTVLSKEKEG